MLRLGFNFQGQDARGRFIEVWRGDEWRAMNFFTINKGFVRGGHYHKETRELFFIVEGECEIVLRDVRTGEESRFSVGEDDMFIVDPYEMHYITALKESKVIPFLSRQYDQTNPDLFTLETTSETAVIEREQIPRETPGDVQALPGLHQKIEPEI